MKRMRAPFAAFCAVALFGCGGGFAAGRAWDPAVESELFDDGVDLLDDPGKLSGEWETSALRAIETRVAQADAVARVEIVSVQTAEDIEGVETRRLSVKVVEILYGAFPSETVALESPASSLGNALIKRHEHRLQGVFVAFVRWFEKGEGKIGHHFHLSPSSAAVDSLSKERVRERVARESAKKE